MVDLETLQDEWREKTIEVANGGKSPSVEKLMKAFQKAWPTETGDSLLNSERTSCIDNYCLWSSYADNGKTSMQARVYRRENGHTLFALCPSEDITFCCFYDYDPETSTLTPEDEPYADFTPPRENSSISYIIAQDDYMEDVILVETPNDDDDTRYYLFRFDGMRHQYYGTSNSYMEKDFSEEESFYDQNMVDISEIPESAERMDSFFQYAVYVNVEDEDGAQSIWWADERTGVAVKVCRTNPAAKARWEQMSKKDSDAVEVPLDEITVADKVSVCSKDVMKIIVEGCPDGRNLWTYVIDANTGIAKQFPSTEGVVGQDGEEGDLILGFYSYDDDGRYSYYKVYSLDGKFLRPIGDKVRP